MDQERLYKTCIASISAAETYQAGCTYCQVMQSCFGTGCPGIMRITQGMSMQFYLGAAGPRRAPCLSTSGAAAHALMIQRPKNGMHSATVEEAEQPQLRKAQVLLVGAGHTSMVRQVRKCKHVAFVMPGWHCSSSQSVYLSYRASESISHD